MQASTAPVGLSAVRADALRLLAGWADVDPDETVAAGYIREFLAAHPDATSRHCAAGAHLTGSAVVVDPDSRRVLLTLHPKFSRWMQLGGHFEASDATVSAAVLREVEEESGLSDVHVDPVPLGVGVFPGAPCPAGRRSEHLDVRFLVLADAAADLRISDESLDLAWWPLSDLPDPCDEDLRRLARQAAARVEH